MVFPVPRVFRFAGFCSGSGSAARGAPHAVTVPERRETGLRADSKTTNNELLSWSLLGLGQDGGLPFTEKRGHGKWV